MYVELDIFAVIFGVDAETTSGRPFTGNDYTADIVERYPDRFMGFASVDPHKGKAAVNEMERSVKDLGLRGLKLHPISQAFFPNDTRFYPLWEKCADLGVPVLFHSGQTAVGAGLPGGGGLKIKYAQPIHMDDVAADFPELNIIMAHPSRTLAGGAALDSAPQAQRLHRPLRLVAQILPAHPPAVRQQLAPKQGDVRLRLPRVDPPTLARRLRRPRPEAGGATEDTARQRGEASRNRRQASSVKSHVDVNEQSILRTTNLLATPVPTRQSKLGDESDSAASKTVEQRLSQARGAHRQHALRRCLGAPRPLQARSQPRHRSRQHGAVSHRPTQEPRQPGAGQWRDEGRDRRDHHPRNHVLPVGQRA